MANTKQAKKRVRQNAKRREQNASQRSLVRTHIKKVVKAIDSRDKAAAELAYQQAVPILDSMARKGIIAANKAARHKSRLLAHIRAMQ